MSKMSELHYEREVLDAGNKGPEGPTWCSECDNVHNATRSQEPWKWRCTMIPINSGFGFVHPDYSPNPPFERCSVVNRDGDCEWFTPLRKPTGESNAS